MNYFITFLLCYFSIITPIFSQEIDSLLFSTISIQLVNQHKFFSFNEEDYKELERRGDCIYIKEEDFKAGCVSSFWDTNWTTDFDGDTIDDLVIKMIYKGLGPHGENISEHTFKIVTLDNDKKIKNTYDLYGGEIMGSDALLSIDSVKNGNIYASYQQNPLQYGFETEKLEYVSLKFFIKNNKIEERNYQKCQLAKIDKKIFNDHITFEKKESFSHGEVYNEKKQEILYLDTKNYYTASISGCENINLSFAYQKINHTRENKSKKHVKESWLTHLDFLAKNTKYAAILTELKTKLAILDKEKIEIQEYFNAQLEISLSNHWKANLDFAFNIQSKDDISIQLIQSSDDQSIDFWESLKKKVAN